MRKKSPYNKGGKSAYIYNRLICALNKMNIQHNIQEQPWKRAKYLVKINSATAFLPAASNEQRNREYIRSTSINKGEINFYSPKSIKPNPSIEELFKMSHGVIRGTNARKWAKEKGLNFIEARDQDNLIQMFRSNRFAVLLTSKESLTESIGENKIKLFNVKTAYTRYQYVFFSKLFIKQNPLFLEKFNKNIIRCSLLSR